MNEELVTAGVFGDHTQAVVVRMHLEEAGIPAFLLDELMSPGLFVIGSATGGIRLQVPASRLNEAIRLINDRLPENAAPVDWSDVDVGEPEGDEAVDEEEIDPESRAERVAPSVAPAELVPPPTQAVVEIEPLDRTLREQRADRIVRGALIGLFAWPVYFLAIWRLVQIANSEERFRPEYQRKANIAAIIIATPWLLGLATCCLIPLYQLAR